MDNSTIGIKIADGTYRSIIEGESLKKKKLVLTTANDDQGSVQIDLFRGNGPEMTEPQYIGSLVIEDIIPAGKGEPEIELIVGVDKDGNLNAVAGDVASGEKQSLSVSLESLDENGFDTPNFELDEQDFGQEPDLGDLPDFKDDEGASFSDESVFNEEPFLEDDLVFDEVLSIDEESSDGESSADDEMDLDDEFSLDDEMTLEDEFTLDDEMSFEDEPDFDKTLVSDDETSFDDGGIVEEPVFGEVPEFDEESEDFNDLPSYSDESNFDDVFDDEDDSPLSDSADFDSEDEARSDYKKKRNPLAAAAIIIIILLLVGIGVFLYLRGMEEDSLPSLVADNNVESTADAAGTTVVPEAEPVPVPEQPASEPVPAVVISAEVPPEIPAEGRGGGVWYRLKWGDTLWNLSISFYRTPWLYGLIAVENGIKNPDLIYAGTDLFIPEN